jgi:hypothetical protein
LITQRGAAPGGRGREYFIEIAIEKMSNESE